MTQPRPGDHELTTNELRAVAAYAAACAEPALVLFDQVRPDDRRPAAALQAPPSGDWSRNASHHSDLATC